MRILIVGEGRSPIHEAAWQRGLEAAGCAVERFDWLSRFQSRSPWRSLSLRAQDHFLAGPTLLKLNVDVVRKVASSRPDVLILYRPTHVLSSAIRLIRAASQDTLIVSYNNDDPFSPKAPRYRWYHYLDSLPLVDVAIAYREKNLAELTRAGAAHVHLVRSYFVPYLDKPTDLSLQDHQRYDADVVFVGHFEPDGRLETLAAVAERFRRFRLFGPDWERAPDHPALRRLQPIRPLSHLEYAKALQSAKIALAFFSSLNSDDYTRRVFEIPAVGTFMLSQRTAVMESLFRPGIEADYFGSPDELLSKIDQYLGDETQRRAIAQAGALRVREQGHDVFSRMRELLSLLDQWRCDKRSLGLSVSRGDGRSHKKERNRAMSDPGTRRRGEAAKASLAMKLLQRVGRDDVAWTLRRLHVPVDKDSLVLEVGSGGNPFPRSNVLLDAYEVTRERHYQPLVADRPTVLGLVENMPFRDGAFDFVIACHVIEHSTDIAACVRELQRVARAGYIECPDAFFERINPYKDHRYEITVRDGALVTRRKRSWIQDAELVNLYEENVKASKSWLGHLRRNPFPFHVRYYWSRESGGIRTVDVTPVADATVPFQSGLQEERSQPSGANIRSRIAAAARSLLSQSARNRRIDLLQLLRCVSCYGNNLQRGASELVCADCRHVYPWDRFPKIFP